MGALHGITEALRIVTGCYRTWQNVVEALWGVADHYGTLRDITGRYRSVAYCYGMLWECYLCNAPITLQNITELLRKISILPITNWILNFAHH